MNILRQYKGQLCATLILIAVVMLMPFQDYTERSLLSSRMNYPDELIGIIKEEEGVLSVPESIHAVTLSSEDFYYKKGTYEVTFFLKSHQEGSTVSVWDPLYLNENNTSGTALSSAEIPLGAEEVQLSFTIEKPLQCVQFQINAQGALDYNSLFLRSQRGLYRDPWIYAGLILLISAFLLLYRIRRPMRPEVWIFLTFAALWSSLPLFFPWLLNGRDLYFHYGRLFSLSQDILTGPLPVRLHPEMLHGFGYLSSIFYPELLLYPIALLGSLGLSPIGCYQLLLMAANFATAGVSYYAFSRLCRSAQMGLIASFLYTLASYRLVNLYTRAAIGEVLASIFLPLLLLGLYQLFLGDSRKWLISAAAFTGLIQTHLISTELAAGFGVLFGLFYIGRLKDKKRLLHLMLAAGFTVLLNLWYLIPLLQHMGYPAFALQDHRKLSVFTVYTPQMFDAGLNNPAGEAVLSGPIAHEMPYSVGFVLLAGILLFLYICFQKKKGLSAFSLKLGKWCLGFGLLSLYASSAYFPWEKIQSISLLNRIVEKIQFPFRFLPFAILFLCIVSAIGIYEFSQSEELRRLLFLVFGFWTACSAGFFFSNYFDQAGLFVSWNSQMDHVLDTDDMYLFCPEGITPDPAMILTQDTAFLPSDGVSLQNCSRKGTDAAFTYTKSGEFSGSYVDVSLNAYPCFHAYDSQGRQLKTAQGEGLRLRVFLPEASSETIVIRYELPFIYRIGDVISLLTLLFLGGFTVLSYKKKIPAADNGM